MFDRIPESRIERRKGPDIWIRLLSWTGILGWLAMLVAFIILDRAKPRRATFIDLTYFRQMGIDPEVNNQWNTDLVDYIFYLMSFGLLVSIIGIAINKHRHRRRDDSYRLYLILLGAISLFGIVYYLV